MITLFKIKFLMASYIFFSSPSPIWPNMVMIYKAFKSKLYLHIHASMYILWECKHTYHAQEMTKYDGERTGYVLMIYDFCLGLKIA